MTLAARMAAIAAQAVPLAVPLPLDPKRELHIDGDYAAYYYAGGPDVSLEAAKVNMLNAFSSAKEWVGAGGRVVVHLTCPSSHKGHRYRIARVKDYQAHRVGSEKPKNWAGMRAFLETNLASLTGYVVKMWADREADDGVAVAAAYAISKGIEPAILSRDKDFRMIPGLHLVWTTHARVSVGHDLWWKEHEGKVYGRAWFWIQMLMGDGADNIPGLPKIPAKAEGKFKQCGGGAATDFIRDCNCNDMAYYKVAGLYRAFYKKEWAVQFAEQAVLLWMRNDPAADVNNWLQVVPYGERNNFAAALAEMEARK